MSAMSSSASVSRRGFVAAAGAATVALAGSTAVASVAHAAEGEYDDTYDVIVVGYGAAG